MKPGSIALFVLAGLAASIACAEPGEIRKTLHVRIALDAAGRVSDVSVVEPRVPAAIAAAMQAKVRGWRFEPVLANGTAVPAVTYASFFTCALPSADGFDLSVRYLDLGPLKVREDRLEYQPVVSNFSKADQSVVVKMTVLETGRAQLQDVVMVDIDPRIDRDMRLSIKHWVDGMRFEPEQVGGQPVATALEWPILFWADTGEEHHRDALASPRPPCDATRAIKGTPHPSGDRFVPHEAAASTQDPGTR